MKTFNHEMPMSDQPRWKMIANLGDVNPIDHGGYFVYIDLTGRYPPQVELLEVDGYNADGACPTYWTVYRVVLERCAVFTDPCATAGCHQIVSENAHHPDHRAWFSDSLDRVASTVGRERKDLVNDLVGDNIIRRAEAYRAILDYHGWLNLDDSPLTFTSRREVTARYREYRKL